MCPPELSLHNAPPCSPTSRRLRQPHPLKPPHLPPASHHRAPWNRPYCAHAQGQSRVRACRTVREEYAAPAARGMQTEMPPKQAALARQRMNRLGKPEHRARFCFFSKKKSPAGMRRFRIPSKIQIRMGFNRSAASFATPKTFLQSPSFAGAKRQPHPLESPPHNVPPCSPASRRFAP